MPTLNPTRLATAALARLAQPVQLASGATVRGLVESADQSLLWSEGRPRLPSVSTAVWLAAAVATGVEKHTSIVLGGQSYRVVDIDPADLSGLVRLHVRPDPTS